MTPVQSHLRDACAHMQGAHKALTDAYNELVENKCGMSAYAVERVLNEVVPAMRHVNDLATAAKVEE